MPHILPIEQQTDLNKIARLCNEKKEPVFLTKDGAGALAILDMESYDKLVRHNAGHNDDEMDGVDLLLSLHNSLDIE